LPTRKPTAINDTHVSQLFTPPLCQSPTAHRPHPTPPPTPTPHANQRAGNSYLRRAIIASAGLGANQPEDAIYPLLLADADGGKLVGPSKYELRFKKGELPPVGAFWSVTLYDKVGGWVWEGGRLE